MKPHCWNYIAAFPIQLLHFIVLMWFRLLGSWADSDQFLFHGVKKRSCCFLFCGRQKSQVDLKLLVFNQIQIISSQTRKIIWKEACRKSKGYWSCQFYNKKQLVTLNNTLISVFEIAMFVLKQIFEDWRKNPEEDLFPFLTFFVIIIAFKHAWYLDIMRALIWVSFTVLMIVLKFTT